MRSQRQLRVGETIRHALASLLQRGDIPWSGGQEAPMITVTEVEISPDLRSATAFVMPMGGIEGEAAAKILNANVGFFRHALAEAVKLRYVPTLTFRADTSFAYANNIERILADPKVAKDLAPPRQEKQGDGQDDNDLV